MLRSTPRVAPLIALAVGLAIGCGKKEEGPESPAPKPKPVTTDTIKVPPSVWVYGGSQPLGATLDTVTGFAQKVIPSAPSLKEMVGPLLSSNFGITRPDFVDLTRPLRFAFFAPNPKGDERVAILLPIKDTKGFAKLVSDKGKATNVENNALVYTPNPSGPKTYVNFTGDYAVYTTDAKLYGAEKAFLTSLSVATMPVSAAAYFQLANIMKAVGKDFDSALAMARAEMRRTMKGPARNQLPMIDAMIEGFGETAREIDRVRFALVMAADGLQLDFRVAAKADAELAGSFAKLKSNGHALLARLPADAALFASFSIEPTVLAEWSQRWVSAFVIKPIFGEQPKAKQYLDAMMGMLEGMTGDFAVSAHGAPGGLGLTLSSIFGVTDGAKVNAAQDTVWQMYSEPEMVAYNTRHGLKMEFGKPTPFAGTTIRENHISFTELGMNPAAALMGDLGMQYIAVGKDLGVMSYGVEGKAVVEGYLKGTYKGLDQTPAAKRLLAKGAKNAFGFLYLSPLALAQRTHLGGMNPVAASLAGLSAKSGVAFSTGVVEGQLQVVIDLPLEFAVEAFATFQKLKGSL